MVFLKGEIGLIMSSFNEVYSADIQRYGNGKPSSYDRKFLKYLRKYQTSTNKLGRFVYRMLYLKHSEKHCIEIPCNTKIGKGLMLCHSYNITVNPKVVIGENVSLHKGVLLGQTNRGRQKGAPVIGNRVWIGINAAIVGGITVGDDVLIAPNAYVNVDVPSHSVVYGNPCVIKPRENATEGYLKVAVES